MKNIIYYFEDKKIIKKIIDLDLNNVPNNSVVIKNIYTGICSTDKELFNGYMNFSGIAGHEFVGNVIYPETSHFFNKRVVGDINIGCGRCQYCLNNNEHHCPTRNVLGILNHPGVFQEYFILPEKNLVTVPESLDNQKAVFAEPVAAALQILNQINIKSDDDVLVMGDGKLGLLIVQVLQTTGANIFIKGNSQRHNDILEKLNLSYWISNNKKFDYVVDATGNKNGFSQALSYVKPCGTIILKTTVSEKYNDLDLAKIIVDEITIVGSRCGSIPDAVNFLSQNKINTDILISKIFNFADFENAVGFSRKKSVLKVLLKY